MDKLNFDLSGILQHPQIFTKVTMSHPKPWPSLVRDIPCPGWVAPVLDSSSATQLLGPTLCDMAGGPCVGQPSDSKGYGKAE